jgi:hypothetical protein
LNLNKRSYTFVWGVGGVHMGSSENVSQIDRCEFGNAIIDTKYVEVW